MNVRAQIPGSQGHQTTLAQRDAAPAGAWHAGAAYLYVLCLDPVALAWEYLRRNPDYGRDWSAARQSAQGPEMAWGLVALEDPRRDARDAQPIWQPARLKLPTLVAVDAPSPSSSRFSVWALPGHKSLACDGARLTLTLTSVVPTLRIGVPAGLGDGDAYGYVIEPGAGAQNQWRRIQACEVALRSGSQPVQAIAQPVDRRRPVHMRTLQALDGLNAGASHRAIACALFGVSRVTKDWHPDGDLRAQVRFLIRRGRVLMREGYLALLDSDSVTAPRQRSRDSEART